MSWTGINAALNTRLNTLASHPPIAWPNVEYDRSIGTVYLKPTTLPGRTNTDTIQGGESHPGIYQIEVWASRKNGIAVVTQWIDAIRAHFPIGLVLTSGTTRVIIEQRSMGVMDEEDAWFRGIVEIFYFSND